MDRRGGDVQMLTTYHLLKDQPDISQLVMCCAGSALAQDCVEQSVPFVVTNKRSKFSLSFIKRILHTVKVNHIDVIHVHDAKAHSAVMNASLFLPAVKIVLSQKRDNVIRNTLLNRWKYNSTKLVKIICLSQAIRKEFEAILTAPEKAVVIYDGIDTAVFAAQKSSDILRREFKLSDDTFVVGSAGALVGQKDFITFLKAAHFAVQNTTKSLTFIILGEGADAESLRTCAVQLGLQDKVIFTGFRKDFAQVLLEFDVLMMSSVSEGLPLTLLSAMAAGVPVVTTAAGGIGEVISQGETGMISPIKEPKALANNLLELLRNEALRLHIAAKAQHLIHEKFTLSAMQESYLTFYRSL